MATIMALVCFAFVQPMPEDTARSRAGKRGAASVEVALPGPDQVSEAPPFVDSVLTGKTFTPYTTISASPVLHIGGPQGFEQVDGARKLPSAPPEPLIRPG